MHHDPAEGHHTEEPQEARGAPGSRGTGDDDAGGGPFHRPSEPRGSTAEESTGVNPQEPISSDMPTMPSGDQGG
jgi:hypothetical protein